MSRSGPGFTRVLGFLVVLVATPAGAQENLDHGKTAAQLFASDCAICHKTPQGVARAGGRYRLDEFLRQHYTASRESAAVLAAYLQAIGNAPAPATKRGARGGERPKGAEKKPAAGKSGDAKTGAGKPAESKPSESKPAESKPSEPNAAAASQAKSAEPKPSEPKPGEGSKPE
jgi:hypothetical protein